MIVGMSAALLQGATGSTQDIDLWRQPEPMSTKGAELAQTLTLFAVINDVHQPILTVDRVLYKVPEGWWQATIP